MGVWRYLRNGVDPQPDRIVAQRTTFLIAQRLPTVRHADLLVLGGIYARVYESSFLEKTDRSEKILASQA